jgi:predicted ester cyclase
MQMKLIYLSCLLLSGVLFSCNNSANQSNSDTTNHLQKKEKTMSVRNKETVRKLYEECLNKRNFDLLKEFISEKYTGIRDQKGPEGMRKTVQPIIDAFPDIKWKVEDMIEEGNKVAVRWSWEGTHTAPYYNVAPTQKKVINHAIAIYEFQDNKIVASWIENDRLGFLLQVGVVSPDVIPPPSVKAKN